MNQLFQTYYKSADLNLLTFLMSIFLLAACDPGVRNTFMIDNQSEFEAILKFKKNEGLQSITALNDTFQIRQIQAGHKISFMHYGEIGRAHDKEELFLEGFDTLIVLLNNVNMTSKVLKRERWDYKVVNKGLMTMDAVEYTLILQNEDLNSVKK